MNVHRRRLGHAEMVGAFTTAAVINFSFAPPKEPVEPREFMPNFKAPSEQTPQTTLTEDDLLDWQIQIANLSAEMKAGGGPMLDEIRSKADG
jgi:hypothetical protein